MFKPLPILIYFQHTLQSLSTCKCVYILFVYSSIAFSCSSYLVVPENCFSPSKIITLDICLHGTYAAFRVNGAAWKWCDPSETVTSALLPFNIKHTLWVFWRKLSFELCCIHLALRLSNLQAQSAVNTWVLVGCPWWKSSAVRNIKMYTYNKLL